MRFLKPLLIKSYNKASTVKLTLTQQESRRRMAAEGRDAGFVCLCF